jgi:hypothetical protein
MYNLNTFSIQNEDLEIKKKSEKKNLHRLFLPALREKNIIIDSNNNLNSDTFRNTSHTRILKSVNERIKQFELFKPGRNSITTTMKKSINNMPVINTKLIDKYCETNKSIKILNLEKEFEALPKQIKTERPENKFNILINKDKIKDLLKSKKLKVPINLKQGKITMKNMLNKNEETNQEISNVNDYIMNYSSIKRFSSDKSNNRIKIKLDKNFKNNETNINKENNYSQTIGTREKKLIIKKTENDSYYHSDKEKNSNKIQDNIINEYKENVNNNISSSENNSIEENNDRNNKNDKNERKTTSERSRSKFSSEKSDSGSEIIKKIVSENESFEKKDPLDDIEYLKKFRQENEKENLKRFEHLLSDDDDNEEDIKENEENKEKRKSISTSKRESKFKSVNKFDFLY